MWTECDYKSIFKPIFKNIENDIQETIEKWPKFMKPDYLEVTTQLPKSIEDRNIWKYYIEEKTMKILKKNYYQTVI